MLVDEIHTSGRIFVSSQFDENDVDGAEKHVLRIAELHLFEFTGGTNSPCNCNSYT